MADPRLGLPGSHFGHPVPTGRRRRDGTYAWYAFEGLQVEQLVSRMWFCLDSTLSVPATGTWKNDIESPFKSVSLLCQRILICFFHAKGALLCVLALVSFLWCPAAAASTLKVDLDPSMGAEP